MSNYFGSFLDKTLQDMKISRMTLATLVCVERDTVRKWCNGKEHPNGTQLRRISDVLNIQMDQMERRIEDDKKAAIQVSTNAKRELISLVRRLSDEKTMLWLRIIKQVEFGSETNDFHEFDQDTTVR